jgi:hypothetical protein
VWSLAVNHEQTLMAVCCGELDSDVIFRIYCELIVYPLPMCHTNPGNNNGLCSKLDTQHFIV